MSLLTMVNNVALEIGLDATDRVITGETQYQQIARFIIRTGKKLISSHGWRATKVTATFEGNGAETLFNLPDHFDRLTPGLVIWRYGQPFMPLTHVLDSQMLMIQSAPYTGPWPVWRLVGQQIELFPAPELGGVYNFGYRTNQFIEDADGVTLKDTFTADNDTVLLPEDILELGAIWRFKAAKGFEYAENFREFELERAKAENADSGQPIVRLATYSNSRNPRRNAYTVNG